MASDPMVKFLNGKHSFWYFESGEFLYFNIFYQVGNSIDSNGD
jgi:hypothetical protein